MIRRAGAVAWCGSLCAFCAFAVFGATDAYAQEIGAGAVVIERGTAEVGYLTEARPAPTDRIHDFHVDLIPELMLLVSTPRTTLNLTYTFTFSAHTFFSTQLANQLALNATYQTSARGTLLFSATASQSQLNSLFLSTPVAVGGGALAPAPATNVITANVGQGYNYEVSPRVLFEQHLTVNAFTTLAPAPPLDTLDGVLDLALERIWQNDAFGAQVQGGYFIAHAVAPATSEDLAVVSAGPRWRHDWSQTVSSLIDGGVGVLEPTDHKAPIYIYPFARASVIYTAGNDVSFDLTGTTGVSPNPLTGQAVQSTQGTLHGVVPISQHARVYAGGSVGFVRGRIIDRVNLAANQSYSAILTDAELIWRPTPILEVFGRYTFVGQLNDSQSPASQAISPSFLRDSILFGVTISSRAPEAVPGGGVSGVNDLTGGAKDFSQRVDGSDGSTNGDTTNTTPPIVNPNKSNNAAPNADEQAPVGAGGSRWIVTTPKPTESD